MQGIINIEENTYPQLLRQVKDAPNKLYYKGNIDADIFENCLAVVGSRRMTKYGKQVTSQLVSEIAKYGITIVSGFMYGIDSVAHEAALDVKGKTIAVMPCGIDEINPNYQESLYKRIIDEQGLIISEYPGNQKPQLWTYPKRNRLVAGLCKAVLVVEATEKSGSIITCTIAKSLQRKLFAVPGPINSANSKGTLNLIKNGAELVRNSSDILEFFKIIVDKPLFKFTSELDTLSKNILKILNLDALTLDELSLQVKHNFAVLSSALTMLQLQGFVMEEGGKYYVNKG